MGEGKHEGTGVALKDALASGYRFMARLNLSLALEDELTLEDALRYEESLVEEKTRGGL